jgi:hypothetical protein
VWGEPWTRVDYKPTSKSLVAGATLSGMPTFSEKAFRYEFNKRSLIALVPHFAPKCCAGNMKLWNEPWDAGTTYNDAQVDHKLRVIWDTTNNWVMIACAGWCWH